MSVKSVKFYLAEGKQELKDYFTNELKIIEDMDMGDALHGSYKLFSRGRTLEDQVRKLKSGVLTPIYYLQTVKKQSGGEVKFQKEWVYLESDKKRATINKSIRAKMRELD